MGSKIDLPIVARQFVYAIENERASTFPAKHTVDRSVASAGAVHQMIGCNKWFDAKQQSVQGHRASETWHAHHLCTDCIFETNHILHLSFPGQPLEIMPISSSSALPCAGIFSGVQSLK